jgi:hypothetical protein
MGRGGEWIDQLPDVIIALMVAVVVAAGGVYVLSDAAENTDASGSLSDESERLERVLGTSISLSLVVIGFGGFVLLGLTILYITDRDGR